MVCVLVGTNSVLKYICTVRTVDTVPKIRTPRRTPDTVPHACQHNQPSGQAFATIAGAGDFFGGAKSAGAGGWVLGDNGLLGDWVAG